MTQETIDALKTLTKKIQQDLKERANDPQTLDSTKIALRQAAWSAEKFKDDMINPSQEKAEN